MAELAFGHRLAFQGLDDLWVGLAVRDELLQPVFVDRGEASRKHRFLSDRRHFSLPRVDTERSVSCTNHARHRGNENAKSSSRLARTAFGLTSRGLPKRNATAGDRDYFARRKMRLDDCDAVGLTEVMGKSSSKKRP